MRTRSSSALAIVIATIVMTGCPSTTVYRSANPLEPGTWSFSAASGIGAIADREQDTRIPSGHIELQARRGLAEDLDAGIKLFISGIELNATWRILQGNWSWAVAPYLSGTRFSATAATSDSAYLFVGTHFIGTRHLGGAWQLSTGPTTGYGLYTARAGGHAQGVWLGGFVNVEYELSRTWSLVPELSAYRVVSGDVPVDGASVQLGIGVRMAR